MNTTIHIATALSALLLFSGCRTIPAETAPPLSAGEQEQLKAASQRIGANILTALQKNDYPLLLSNIPGELRTQITRKDFETSRKNFEQQFGTITGFRYLADLKTPAVTNMVWIVAFERKSSTGSTVTRELLFRIVTAQVDNAPRVLSYGFF